MANRKPYYEVYQGTDQQWRWRQVAANGQKTAAQGEASASKSGAIQAVATSARIASELTYGPMPGSAKDETRRTLIRLLKNDSLYICTGQDS